MRVHRPTIVAIATELVVCGLILALATSLWSPLAVLLAWCALATRQHALFILYHDGVHGLIARPRRLNDLIVNATIGVPQLLPIHIYRSLHLVHHQQLGTEADPERVLLYKGQPWAYHPLPLTTLVRQVLGDVFLYNNLQTVYLYARERLAGSPALDLPKSRMYPETLALFAAWFGAWAALIIAAPSLAAQLALLWFVPLLTLTQAIQKVRSFAEHAALDAPQLSYSWRPSLIGRVVLWPYNIQYHHEHHEHANLPWDELPAIAGEPHPSSTLLAHLWNGSLR